MGRGDVGLGFSRQCETRRASHLVAGMRPTTGSWGDLALGPAAGVSRPQGSSPHISQGGHCPGFVEQVDTASASVENRAHCRLAAQHSHVDLKTLSGRPTETRNARRLDDPRARPRPLPLETVGRCHSVTSSALATGTAVEERPRGPASLLNLARDDGGAASTVSVHGNLRAPAACRAHSIGMGAVTLTRLRGRYPWVG
jgi:hypothetical protein